MNLKDPINISNIQIVNSSIDEQKLIEIVYVFI